MFYGLLPFIAKEAPLVCGGVEEISLRFLKRRVTLSKAQSHMHAHHRFDPPLPIVTVGGEGAYVQRQELDS